MSKLKLAALLLTATLAFGAIWPGTYVLPVFNEAALASTAADTSLIFDIPENASGYFSIEYTGSSATDTSVYTLYFQMLYPRQTVYGTRVLETLNWDTIWVTPAYGIIADSVVTDTARFETLPVLRGAKVRLIVAGKTGNPADTKFSARIIADLMGL